MTIAIAIILHPVNGKVLISQRKSDAHKGGLWEFPGGKCLPDEPPQVCAVRETREETGLEIAVLEAWPILTYAYPERTVELHPFLCRAERGEAQALESRQIAWVSPSELAFYQFPEANAPLLARLSDSSRSNPSGFTG